MEPSSDEYDEGFIASVFNRTIVFQRESHNLSFEKALWVICNLIDNNKAQVLETRVLEYKKIILEEEKKCLEEAYRRYKQSIAKATSSGEEDEKGVSMFPSRRCISTPQDRAVRHAMMDKIFPDNW